MKATKTISPVSYLLIGSGRVARHLGHYFHLLNINYASWDRSQDPHALRTKISAATHVLLAISDNALEAFYRQHLAGHEKVLVHFSGALNVEGMISAHPLMTFGPELYDLGTYQKIHFTLSGVPSLEAALPGLQNPFSNLAPEHKALYHAHCVLGGNFVTLLIGKMLQAFQEFNIPPEAAQVYLEKILDNVLSRPDQALTGPLVRKDSNAVQMNLNALKDDPYLTVYQAFLKTHWPDYPRK